MEESNKQDCLALIIFVITCIVLYFNSLQGVFVFDDFHSIPDNLYIKDIRHIPLFFKGHYTSDPVIPSGMFRPLLMITFVFNYAFSRLEPLGYHIVNIILHFLNVILLYRFLKILKKDLPFGLVLSICLLFLAHPLNTEAVTYISARSDLLACFFILTTFLCYVQKKFLFAVVLYIFGLLSKETALVLPFLVFGFDFLRPSERDYADVKKTPRFKYMFYIVLLGVSIIYWIYRQHLFGPVSVTLTALHKSLRNPYSNILTQAAVTLFYLKLFVWPQPLITHHNFPILNSLSQPLAFFSITAIFAIVVSILLLRKTKFLISFGLFWYLICLLPKFYTPLNIVAAEHHFYLPSFGVYLILAVISKNLYLRFRRKFVIISLGVTCIFAILVLSRNYEYTNPFVFWQKALEEDPSSAIAHHNLGLVYVSKGFYEEAEKKFKKALLLSPPYATRARILCADNLSNVYRLQKKYKEALEELNKLIDLKLAYYATYQNLGVVYLEMGDEGKAVEMWGKGLRLNPQASGIYLNIGLHYLRKSEFSKAKGYFKESVKYDPDCSMAYFGLGRSLQELGEIDSAIKALTESVSIEPNHADAHYYLGNLYVVKSDPRALTELREAIRLAPDFAEAHNNLAVLYASMQPQELELARHHAQKALAFGYKVNSKFLKLIGLEQNKAKPIP